MLESGIVDASAVGDECRKAVNLYKEKITLLKENPDGYYYKKSIERNDGSIMSRYHKSKEDED